MCYDEEGTGRKSDKIEMFAFNLLIRKTHKIRITKRGHGEKTFQRISNR